MKKLEKLTKDLESRLAVLDNNNEEATVFVINDVNVEDNTVLLVELDRPADGKTARKNINKESIYLLEPLEVVERVTTWK